MNICQRPGCSRFTKHSGNLYCSRSCVMKHTRSKQTPEERSALGRKARMVQEGDRLHRLIARCLLQPTIELQILAGYRYGLSASKQRRFRVRRATAPRRQGTAA